MVRKLGILSWLTHLFATRAADDAFAPARGVIERPWLQEPWQANASMPSYFHVSAARSRGEAVARLTLGEALWSEFCKQGFLDVPSAIVPGLSYRLRPGHRIQLLWVSREAAHQMRWPYHGYLCVQPTYPLPAIEFLAQLYLYLRDREEYLIRIAIPQASDDAISSVF